MHKALYILFSAVVLVAGLPANAQKINPSTQLNWPLLTGSGAPSFSCSSINYGEPYLNVSPTPNVFYTCTTNGWIIGGLVPSNNLSDIVSPITALQNLNPLAKSDIISNILFSSNNVPYDISVEVDKGGRDGELEETNNVVHIKRFVAHTFGVNYLDQKFMYCDSPGDCIDNITEVNSVGAVAIQNEHMDDHRRFEENPRVFQGTINSFSCASNPCLWQTTQTQGDGQQPFGINKNSGILLGDGLQWIDVAPSATYSVGAVSNITGNVLTGNGSVNWDSHFGDTFARAVASGALNNSGGGGGNIYPRTNVTIPTGAWTGTFTVSSTPVVLFDESDARVQTAIITAVNPGVSITVDRVQWSMTSGFHISQGGLSGQCLEMNVDLLTSSSQYGFGNPTDSAIVDPIRTCWPIEYNSSGQTITLYQNSSGLTSFNTLANPNVSGWGAYTIHPSAYTVQVKNDSTGNVDGNNIATTPPVGTFTAGDKGEQPHYYSGKGGDLNWASNWNHPIGAWASSFIFVQGGWAASSDIQGTIKNANAPTMYQGLSTSNTGIVSTSGTAVTWVSGGLFIVGTPWVGQTITINSVAYTVASVNSTTSLTLTATAGTQTSVAYTGAGLSAANVAGYGMLQTPYAALLLSGAYTSGIHMTTPPFGQYAGNGAVYVGCGGQVWCSNWNTPVWMLTAQNGSGYPYGEDSLGYTPTSKTWTLSAGGTGPNGSSATASYSFSPTGATLPGTTSMVNATCSGTCTGFSIGSGSFGSGYVPLGPNAFTNIEAMWSPMIASGSAPGPNTFESGIALYKSNGALGSGFTAGEVYGEDSGGSSWIYSIMPSSQAGWQWCNYVAPAIITAPSGLQFCNTMKNPTGNGNVLVQPLAWTNPTTQMALTPSSPSFSANQFLPGITTLLTGSGFSEGFNTGKDASGNTGLYFYQGAASNVFGYKFCTYVAPATITSVTSLTLCSLLPQPAANGTIATIPDAVAANHIPTMTGTNAVMQDSGVLATQVPKTVTTCGTTATCGNTVQTSPRIVTGTVTLSSGTALVGSMTAFTSTTSYVCTPNDQTTAGAAKIANTSTSSITITGGTSDVVQYSCVGN